MPGEGAWEVNPITGELSFIPDPGFVGNPTPVSYTVRNDAGFVTSSALVSIMYDPNPCDPIASGNTDSDGDGLSDMCDLDDDNDGILDDNECSPLITTGVTGSGTQTVSGQYSGGLFALDFEVATTIVNIFAVDRTCLLYTSPSPRDS